VWLCTPASLTTEGDSRAVRALEDNALVVTSLVADRMMDAVKVASKVTSVTTVDLWSGLLDQV
jgi:hypothetical protein